MSECIVTKHFSRSQQPHHGLTQSAPLPHRIQDLSECRRWHIVTYLRCRFQSIVRICASVSVTSRSIVERLQYKFKHLPRSSELRRGQRCTRRVDLLTQRFRQDPFQMSCLTQIPGHSVSCQNRIHSFAERNTETSTFVFGPKSRNPVVDSRPRSIADVSRNPNLVAAVRLPGDSYAQHQTGNIVDCSRLYLRDAFTTKASFSQIKKQVH